MGAGVSSNGALPTVRMVRVWSVEDVARMLDAVQLGRYREVFRRNRVNGRRLLEATDAELAQIGVHSVSHRKQLLAHVGGIKQLDHMTAKAKKAEQQQARQQDDAAAADPDVDEAQERVCPACMAVGTARQHCGNMLTVRSAGLTSAPLPSVGEVLHKRYLITRELPDRGNGGTVAIYEAMDLLDRTRAVVKTPAAGLSVTVTRLAVTRLVRELLNCAAVDDVLVMKGLAFAQTATGRVFSVVEYLPGVTARQLLDSNGPMHESDTIGLLTDALTAMQALHDAGRGYRDLRPENVYVGPPIVRELPGKHTYRLGDLALAKPLPDEATADAASFQGRLPKRSSCIGDPTYLSPEAFRGVWSPASDVWAAGVLAFECVVGRPPFAAEQFEDLLEAVLNVPFPVEDIQGRCSPGLLLCIMKALQKDRRDRFVSCREFLDALAEHTDGAAHDLKQAEDGYKRKDEITANLRVARDELSRGPLKQALTTMLTHSVREINLRRADVDISDLETLAEGLKVNASVVELDIGGNRVGDEGIRCIAEALRMNRSVEVLRVWGSAIGPEGATHLANTLRMNRTVKLVDLTNNHVGDEGCVLLANALRVNESITDLSLHQNRIGADGFMAVADMLKSNQTLLRLRLGHNPLNNHLHDDGSLALGEALRVNTVLEWLGLGVTRIGDEGAAAIAEGLLEHPALKFLSLAHNNVRDAGALALAAVLGDGKNTVLAELDLRHNELSEEAIHSLSSFSASSPADSGEPGLVIQLPMVAAGELSPRKVSPRKGDQSHPLALDLAGVVAPSS